MRSFAAPTLLSCLLVLAAVSCGESDGGNGSGNAAGQAAGGAAGKAGESAAGKGGSVPATAGAATGAAGSASGGNGAGGAGTAGSPASSGGSSDGGEPASGGSDGFVDCDTRKVMCKIAVPDCAANEAPSVVGTCYGPCVRIDDCACKTAAECPDPNQYTCWMQQHCGPFVR
jgi:hypothetical protein